MVCTTSGIHLLLKVSQIAIVNVMVLCCIIHMNSVGLVKPTKNPLMVKPFCIVDVKGKIIRENDSLIVTNICTMNECS